MACGMSFLAWNGSPLVPKKGAPDIHDWEMCETYLPFMPSQFFLKSPSNDGYKPSMWGPAKLDLPHYVAKSSIFRRALCPHIETMKP